MYVLSKYMCLVSCLLSAYPMISGAEKKEIDLFQFRTKDGNKVVIAIVIKPASQMDHHPAQGNFVTVGASSMYDEASHTLSIDKLDALRWQMLSQQFFVWDAMNAQREGTYTPKKEKQNTIQWSAFFQQYPLCVLPMYLQNLYHRAIWENRKGPPHLYLNCYKIGHEDDFIHMLRLKGAEPEHPSLYRSRRWKPRPLRFLPYIIPRGSWMARVYNCTILFHRHAAIPYFHHHYLSIIACTYGKRCPKKWYGDTLYIERDYMDKMPYPLPHQYPFINALFAALKYRNDKEVKEIIQKEESILGKWGVPGQVLRICIKYGSTLFIVKQLVNSMKKQGVSLHKIVNEKKENLIYDCIGESNIGMLHYLINQGVSAKECNINKVTPLMYSCQQDEGFFQQDEGLQKVKMLVKSVNYTPSELNRKDNQGRTVLHFVFRKKNHDMLKYVTHLPGISLNQTDASGHTVFMLCAEHKAPISIVQRVMEEIEKKDSAALFRRDDKGKNAWDYAVRHRYYKMQACIVTLCYVKNIIRAYGSTYGYEILYPIIRDYRGYGSLFFPKCILRAMRR